MGCLWVALSTHRTNGLVINPIPNKSFPPHLLAVLVGPLWPRSPPREPLSGELGTTKTVKAINKTVKATNKTVKATNKTVKATNKTANATTKKVKAINKTVKARE